MYEYVAFNPFNSSPEALAAELTKKSAEGWDVVDIVTTFDGRFCAFLRRETNSAGAPASSVAAAPATAGASATSETGAATPTPAVPSGWYADPSSRYELRYWSGSEWTEHVSRSGQQFTDPPVA